MMKAYILGVFVGCSILVRAAGAQTNLIPNSSFETGTSGWAGTRARITRVRSVGGAPGFGAAVLKVSWAASGAFWDTYVTPRPKQNTAADHDYIGRVFIRHPNAGRVICLKLREWSASSGGSVVQEVRNCVMSVPNTWQEAAVTLSDVGASHAVGFSVERTDPCDTSCYFLIDGARLYEVATPPQCSDGVDNDGDGYIDYPNDPGCISASDTTEAPNPACSNGLDDDGDGRVDMADPMCSGPTDDDEGGDPACNDARDNDSDGKIDFPADPGCSSPSDTDETDPPPTCTKTISPGSSAQALVDSLQPGETGCLRAGVYGGVTFSRGGSSDSNRVTLHSYPGETATIQGKVWVKDSANFVTIEDLRLDGSTTTVASPGVNGDDVILRHNDIFNANTFICVSIGAISQTYGRAYRTLVERNRIHNCGVINPDGTTTNHHHGIYVEDSTGAEIRYNLIYDNADRGVQLYTDADETWVHHNVIDGNGEGVIFGGGDEGRGCQTSDRNTIERNIITNSRLRWLVESWWGCGVKGTGNVVRDDVLWPTNSRDYYNSNCGVDTDPADGGFTATNNTCADPLYVDRAAKNFHLRDGSPALPITGDIQAVQEGKARPQ